MHALDWLGWMMESILQIVPRLRHVRSTHGAVLFWCGRSTVLRSGLHVYWPVCSEIVECAMTRKTHNMTYQDLITRDGQAATVAATIVYQIVDAHRALTNTDDISDTISDLAARAVIRICSRCTASELKSLQKENGCSLDAKLRGMMSRDLVSFGVEVQRAFICELSMPRMIRLISNHGVFN
jgi:regulator of protease activity HflC (stomatin/prohibitin superfamily)